MALTDAQKLRAKQAIVLVTQSHEMRLMKRLIDGAVEGGSSNVDAMVTLLLGALREDLLVYASAALGRRSQPVME